MWICCDCSNVFDEPRIWVEKHGLPAPPYETYSACPKCGGTFAEAYECGCCGHWIDGSYIKLNSGERICENCYTIYNLGEEE